MATVFKDPSKKQPVFKKYIFVSYSYDMYDVQVVEAINRDNAIMAGKKGSFVLCESYDKLFETYKTKSTITTNDKPYYLSKCATLIEVCTNNITISTAGTSSIPAVVSNDRDAWLYYALSCIFTHSAKEVIIGNYIPKINFMASCYYCGDSTVSLV